MARRLAGGAAGRSDRLPRWRRLARTSSSWSTTWPRATSRTWRGCTSGRASTIRRRLAYERANKLTQARKSYERSRDMASANRVRGLEVKSLVERGDRLGAATLLAAAGQRREAVEVLEPAASAQGLPLHAAAEAGRGGQGPGPARAGPRRRGEEARRPCPLAGAARARRPPPPRPGSRRAARRRPCRSMSSWATWRAPLSLPRSCSRRPRRSSSTRG